MLLPGCVPIQLLDLLFLTLGRIFPFAVYSFWDIATFLGWLPWDQQKGVPSLGSLISFFWGVEWGNFLEAKGQMVFALGLASFAILDRAQYVIPDESMVTANTPKDRGNICDINTSPPEFFFFNLCFHFIIKFFLILGWFKPSNVVNVWVHTENLSSLTAELKWAFSNFSASSSLVLSYLRHKLNHSQRSYWSNLKNNSSFRSLFHEKKKQIFHCWVVIWWEKSKDRDTKETNDYIWITTKIQKSGWDEALATPFQSIYLNTPMVHYNKRSNKPGILSQLLSSQAHRANFVIFHWEWDFLFHGLLSSLQECQLYP